MSQDTKEQRLKWIQVVTIVIVFGVGFWQFARAGFDWRVVFETSNGLIFFLAMATLPVFGFPISVCYIYAGLAFDPLTACMICIAALGVNMSASFALTHSVLKGPILSFINKRGWTVPKLSDENEFRFMFLMRTIPGPPFFFQNLVLGLSGISFWTYLWVSLLTQGGIAVAVVLCSRYLSEDPLSKGGITLLIIIVALIIAKSIRAIKQRKSKRSISI